MEPSHRKRPTTSGRPPTAWQSATSTATPSRDIVTANRDGNSISVLPGFGDGTFNIQIEHAAGTGPQSIVVNDLDRDGDADVVIANTQTNTISVLLGLGDLSSPPPMLSYAVGAESAFGRLGRSERRRDIRYRDGQPQQRGRVGVAASERPVLRDRRTTCSSTRLPDGAEMKVPRGVTVMIDAGAVFKLRKANIDVGSSAVNIDRSLGALQVLGTPAAQRLLHLVPRSRRSAQTASRPGPRRPARATGAGSSSATTWIWTKRPSRAGRPRESSSNYVNHADIRYGGGAGDGQFDLAASYAPIHMVEARPTVSFNTITHSADAAMSADPNSFSRHEVPGARAIPFTADYDRVGPDIHGNRLVDNTINGLFVRIRHAGRPVG